MKVGDMVSWHDSAPKKFINGIIVEVKHFKYLRGTGARFIYYVLCSNGVIYPLRIWQLRSVNERR